VQLGTLLGISLILQVPQQSNPTVPILESIYLSDASSEEPVVAPSFVADAVYADTIHIRHSQGLSSINTRPLLDSVLHGGNDDTGSDVSSLISTNGSVFSNSCAR
jgi:hypothetical protein